MPLFKVSVKMKFLFCLAGLTMIVTAKSLSQNELAKYETKLRNYQNMTNIDEDTFLYISLGPFYVLSFAFILQVYFFASIGWRSLIHDLRVRAPSCK